MSSGSEFSLLKIMLAEVFPDVLRSDEPLNMLQH